MDEIVGEKMSNINTSKKILMQVSRNSQPQMLKILRKKQGYTLQELGDLCGLSPSYISRIEAGGRRYNTDILEKLSIALGCDPYDLLKNEIKELGEKEGVSHKMTLPVYGVVSKDVAVNASGYSVVDFDNPIEKIARIVPLIGDKTSFAFYVVDDINEPKYNKGDLMFVGSLKNLQEKMDVLLIGEKNELMIGQVITYDEKSIKIKHYNNQSKIVERKDLQGIYAIVGIFNQYNK